MVAHPYAPLGGCYDDWIVLAVVEECMQKGLVVGTFNFRCVQDDFLGIGGRRLEDRCVVLNG